ncbi:Target of rapamycin complex 2 subunit bit61 [Tolypocladium paradoxum]|uniref:Target of rapamycin complex 2 subunit bit61 n=1 Tax=Tolypocladium paradoxum TaxID=94208 RepID=A0A2S4KP35_9HYPO|nr:Target of rapamycin complex 2 subunit bit61 [Tolypocladium paradoxum]
MQSGQAPSSARPQNRPPGSFSPLPGASSSPSLKAPQPAAPARPPPRRDDSSGSEDSSSNTKNKSNSNSNSNNSGSGSSSTTVVAAPAVTVTKTRQREGSPATPIYNQFANASSSSLHQNFSLPAAAARLVTPAVSSPLLKNHSRKHSATQGLFDSSLPSTNTSNLSHVSMNPPGYAAAAAAAASSASLSASQMAAKAAIMSHQNTSHVRQRSQTVPFPGDANDVSRRSSGNKGPMNPPMLSLTEASAPRDTGFGNPGPYDRVGGTHSSAATAAANVVFPRSGHNSPREKSVSPQFPPVPPVPPTLPEKLSMKAEKSKVKLFSRPGKISTSKGDTKDKPLPSPGKIGTALSALQRGNFSTTSLVDPPSQSLYSLNNSSSATIRPIDAFAEDKGKEKEKKHHFLSRQKQKLKDEYHLPLSSVASNSKPTDPSAPSSLYNFNVPASPGPSSSSFIKAKKDKKLAERSESRLDSESTFSLQGEHLGPGSLPSLSQQSTLYDPVDPGRLGLQNHVSLDDAWPYLKAKLLVIFEGEDLRLPVEDFNRVVQMHIQYCIHKRSPNVMVEDLRDLLATGFSSLDRTLRLTPEDRFLPTLVELWLFTFTSILPYMQSVFLPLDLEVSGCGIIMTPEQARDFWGGVVAGPPSAERPARVAPAAGALDVRRLVLTAYRDVVILPRYDTLKNMFSRLSLEFLPSSFANMALASPPPEPNLSTSPSESASSMARPGTAMSLDPSVGSYNSTSTTLLGDGSERGRSRAVSNVSFGSHGSDGGAVRPFTPSGVQVLSSVREQNVEDSKQVTDMVGRMLQCMSVLSSLGGVAGEAASDEGSTKMVELCKMLKLNWLGRGRTGRNRRGIVGGRVRRDEVREEVRVA